MLLRGHSLMTSLCWGGGGSAKVTNSDGGGEGGQQKWQKVTFFFSTAKFPQTASLTGGGRRMWTDICWNILKFHLKNGAPQARKKKIFNQTRISTDPVADAKKFKKYDIISGRMSMLILPTKQVKKKIIKNNTVTDSHTAGSRKIEHKS